MNADYEELIEDVRKAQAAVGEVKGTAEFDDGLLSVTVAVSGEILELELDPRRYRSLDSVGLSQAIVETVGRAMQDAQQQAFAALKPLLPTGATFDNTDLLVDPMLGQFGPHPVKE